MQAISENSRLVRLPLNVVGNLNKITKITSEFERDYEREPTNDEIEVLLQNENIDIDSARQLTENTISIDAPVGNDQTGTYKRTFYLARKIMILDLL